MRPDNLFCDAKALTKKETKNVYWDATKLSVFFSFDQLPAGSDKKRQVCLEHPNKHFDPCFVRALDDLRNIETMNSIL